MNFLLRSLLGCMSLAVAWSAFAAAAEPAWVAKSNTNAQVLLQLMAKYSPESASQLGVDGFDEQISDLSRDQFEPANAETRSAISELQKRLAGETDSKVKQDLEILIEAAQDRLRSGALSRKYFMPFVDVVAMVYGVTRATLDPRIPKARQQTLLVRLDKYAGLTKGFRPISDLAKERTLERIKADPKLLGPFKGQVDQALNDGPTLLSGIKDLLAKSELKGWEKPYAALEQQCTNYNAWVKTEILPRTRSDHRLPPEVYADNLHQFGVDISPEELISRALTAFAEIRNQMNITAGLIAKERGFADPEYQAVIREMKKQQVPADQVMSLYRERLGQIETAIREIGREH